MLILAVVGLGAMASMALFALLGDVDEKAAVRSSLRKIGGDYEVDSLREKELQVPLADRVLVPLVAGLTDLGRRLTPQGYVDRVRAKLVKAGLGEQEDLDRFLAIRVVTAVAAPIATVAVLAAAPVGGLVGLLLALLVGAALLLGPDSVLDRKVAARQYEIRRKLPDVMDLLVISVEAGLGFEQAIDRTVASVPGSLTEEFSRMLGEVRAGASRSDAMRALDTRTDIPEIRSFVLAILQADTFGVSIGRVLRSQADEMRVKRRQLAEEQAAKAPVKMLLPMVFCIFPALFVVVLGPAAINISNSF